MKPEYGAGDSVLARLLSRAGLRRTIFAALIGTILASLYLRVGLGRSDQVLPVWGAAISVYGLLMVFLSRDLRSRCSWLSLAVLVAIAFARGLLPDRPRLLGACEAGAAVALIAALVSLSRDPRFLENAVLGSGTTATTPRDAAKDPDE